MKTLLQMYCFTDGSTLVAVVARNLQQAAKLARFQFYGNRLIVYVFNFSPLYIRDIFKKSTVYGLGKISREKSDNYYDEDDVQQANIPENFWIWLKNEDIQLCNLPVV